MRKVAVVGAGTMGRVHSSAYSDMAEAQVVAICDAQLAAAQELADAHSARGYADLGELLSQVEVDVVDVCSPTPTHLQYIKAAAAAGKDVVCEKPLARTIGQAQEAIRLCEEANVRLFVAHVLRWFPEFRKLHDLVMGGAMGDAVVVRTTRGGRHPSGVGNWFADAKQSGGVVLDLIIHDFDWLRWCFGRVTRVYARGLYEAGIPGTDYALVTLRFENGVVAHVEGDWARPSGFVTSVEVAGTTGLLSFSSDEAVPLKIERRAEGGVRGGVLVPESPLSVSPYYRELHHFIACLEEGWEPEVKPEDGLEAVRIAEAALRSIGTGQAVALA